MRDICPVHDGGYMLAGYTESFWNGRKESYLVRIEDDGEVQWEEHYRFDNSQNRTYAIETEVIPGTVREIPLTIFNRGDELLEFSVTFDLLLEEGLAVRAGELDNEGLSGEGPHRDDPGDVIRDVHVPYNRIRDICWDGALMWGLSTDFHANLFAYDPDTDEIVRERVLETPFTNFTFDGTYFWIMKIHEPWIWIYDYELNFIEQIPLPGRSLPRGMCSDRENFMLVNSGGGEAFCTRLQRENS